MLSGSSSKSCSEGISPDPGPPTGPTETAIAELATTVPGPVGPPCRRGRNLGCVPSARRRPGAPPARGRWAGAAPLVDRSSGSAPAGVARGRGTGPQLRRHPGNTALVISVRIAGRRPAHTRRRPYWAAQRHTRWLAQSVRSRVATAYRTPPATPLVAGGPGGLEIISE